ncbi:hypothetical protein [Methylomonas koyamae]|nr:hypothetical protein [Methylomonas koyamae]
MTSISVLLGVSKTADFIVPVADEKAGKDGKTADTKKRQLQSNWRFED